MSAAHAQHVSDATGGLGVGIQDLGGAVNPRSRRDWRLVVPLLMAVGVPCAAVWLIGSTLRPVGTAGWPDDWIVFAAPLSYLAGFVWFSIALAVRPSVRRDGVAWALRFWLVFQSASMLLVGAFFAVGASDEAKFVGPQPGDGIFYAVVAAYVILGIAGLLVLGVGAVRRMRNPLSHTSASFPSRLADR